MNGDSVTIGGLVSSAIFGFDIDIEPILIEGKTFEEWVKYWVNSWFE